MTGAVNDADAIPSSYDPYRSGYIANVYREHLLYDSSTDRLSYTGWNRFDLRHYPCAPCDETRSFDGLFVWDAGVDEHGLTDSGSMHWYGDFGSGYELLASGDVLNIIAPLPNIFHEANYTSFSRLSTIFTLDYLSPAVSGMMGNQIWFDFEYQFDFRSITHSLFADDFDCIHDGDPYFDGDFGCSPWSYSGLIGLNVPEPSTLSLMLLGLFGFGALRRRSIH